MYFVVLFLVVFLVSFLFVTMEPHEKRRRVIRRYIFAGAVTTFSLGFTILASIGVSRLISPVPYSLVKDDTVAATSATEVPSPDAVTALSSDQLDAQQKEQEQKPLITTYTVKSGDTISEIADQFHISINTIRWANDIPVKGTIKVGDELVILPFSGIEYKVKKSDTLSGITLKYGGNEKEIMDINNLESAKDIVPGDILLIPDGEMPAPKPAPKPVTKTTTSTKTPTSTTSPTTTTSQTPAPTTSSSSFIQPIPGSQLTQGLHAVNAVDFGAPVGTSVRAAAAGTVIIAKNTGYNGGFGKYVVINHSDGTQTLYAHMSAVTISVGATVSQGQVIGRSGNTGRSTGPHLHFEVHGATNPWARNAIGTHY